MNLNRQCYLNLSAVHEFLSFSNPDHIMVHVSPNLQDAVGAVMRQAVGAKPGAAIKAKNILFVSLVVLVNYAGAEEFLSQKRWDLPLQFITLILLYHIFKP